ncbi:MAG: hypothetical protein JRI37_11890 [Deltaproteobacteria bacterium]|nr:hypothetical protein [Deltaproteobacteria bacterium]
MTEKEKIFVQRVIEEILPLARMNLENIRLEFKERVLSSEEITGKELIETLEYDKDSDTLWYLPRDIIDYGLTSSKGLVMKEVFRNKYAREDLLDNDEKLEFVVLFNIFDVLRAVSLGIAEFMEAGNWIKTFYNKKQEIIALWVDKEKMRNKPLFIRYLLGLVYRFTEGEDDERIEKKKVKELIQFTSDIISPSELGNIDRNQLYRILKLELWPYFGEILEESVKHLALEKALEKSFSRKYGLTDEAFGKRNASLKSEPGSTLLEELKEEINETYRQERTALEKEAKSELKKQLMDVRKEFGDKGESTYEIAEQATDPDRESEISQKVQTRARLPEINIPKVLSGMDTESGDGWGGGDGDETGKKIVRKLTGLSGEQRIEYNQLRNSAREKALRVNLRRLLEDFACSQRGWDSRLSRGKLDLRKIAEAFAGETKIFKKRLGKAEPKCIRYSIITDVSGSMFNGVKLFYALSSLVGFMEATSGLTDELEDIINIEIEIVIFSSNWQIILDYEEGKLSLGTLRERYQVITDIKSSSILSGGTENIPAIEATIERINNRSQPEDINTIIIITDGISANIRKIYKRHKDIFFLPLGIGEYMIKIEESYAPYGKAIELEDLPKTVLNIGRKQLERIRR